MLENNVESSVPTNTDTFPVFVLNNSVLSYMEEILLDMNLMYEIPMDIKQEVLNNQAQFSKQIKRKM